MLHGPDNDEEHTDLMTQTSPVRPTLADIDWPTLAEIDRLAEADTYTDRPNGIHIDWHAVIQIDLRYLLEDTLIS